MTHAALLSLQLPPADGDAASRADLEEDELEQDPLKAAKRLVGENVIYTT